jgi:hypothetical protein
VSSCTGDSNGYACYCSSSNSTLTYSSLCQPINANLTAAALDPSALFGQTSTSLSKLQWVGSMRQLQLMSELPAFAFDYLPASATELLSAEEFATYLQIRTNYIRNHPNTTLTEAAKLANFALSRMVKVLDPYAATVLAGPGYYFKYVPAAMETDDASVVQASRPVNTQSAVLLLYSSTYSASQITPSAFVFLDPTSSATSCTLTLKKVNFLGSYQSYQVNVNGAASVSASVSQDSQGYLTILNVPLGQF